MASYPYYSPPPPSPLCNDTTPTLPPPSPACNHTTSTPTLSPLRSPPPPAKSHYSHPPPLLSSASPTPPPPPPPTPSAYPFYLPPPPSSPCNTTTPTLQPPPPPPTACACNKTSPTLPPPASPSPHSSYYSPPLASLPAPPPPPSTRYSPSLHSPPPLSHPSPAAPPPPPFYYSPPPFPPSSSDYSPPPLSQSPPKPSKASPPPLLQPTTPPPAPSPYYSPQTPLHPPLAPDPPLCHCSCPSPWAHYYPSVSPNDYPSIAPSPQFLSPTGGSAVPFVSLGGLIFLAFITYGLISMAMKKKIPTMPTTSQHDSHVGGQGHVQTSTSVDHSAIEMGQYLKPIPPDQGASHVKEEEILQHNVSAKPLSNPSVTDEISADPGVQQQTFEHVKQSDDANKKWPPRKPFSNKGVLDSTQGMDQESMGDDHEKVDEKLDEHSRNPLGDQSVTDNTNQDGEPESDVVKDESNDSKKNFRRRNRKPFNGRKGKQTKPSKLVGQAMKASILGGEQGHEDDDFNEAEGHDDPPDAQYESNGDEDEDKSNGVKEESSERNRKPLADQSMPDNSTKDVEQESNAVEDESNESKQRLRHRKKYPSSRCKGKQGETKSSKLVGQAMKATILVEEQETEDDDFNEAEVHDAPLDAEHESNGDGEESNECNRKPPGDRSMPDNSTEDVEQECNAVEDESNDSKQRLHHGKKNPSNVRKGKQGETKPSKLAGQAMKAVILPGEQKNEDEDFNEAEEHDAPPGAEHESNGDEEESNELNRKPLGDQSMLDNSTIDVQQESNVVEDESNDSKKILRHHKKNPSNVRKVKQGETKPSKLVGQVMKAAILAEEQETEDDDFNEAKVHDAPPDEEHKSNGDEEESNGPNRKPLGDQSIPDNCTEDVKQEYTAVEDESNESKQRLHHRKKNPSNGHKGKQGETKLSNLGDSDKEEESESLGSNTDSHLHTRQISVRRRKEPFNVGQILTAPIGGDPGMYLNSHADDDEKDENDDLVNECDDPCMECESFVDDKAKKAESKSFGSKKVSYLQKRQTGAQRRKEAPDVGQTSTTPIDGDVGVDLKSLADDYGKEENEDPSIECDNPNVEYYELLVDDDAKEGKSDSFGPKKDSRLHKRQIGAQGRRDPHNVGQIWSNPLSGDPSTYFKTLADDDEKEEKEDQGMECDDPSMELESLVDDSSKEEESESFGLKKVTSLQKRQIGGHGRKGPPNVGQILNIPTGGDAAEDLKLLANEQKKLELFGRKEVSPLHKHQAGAGGRKEPPNLGQILTATTGSDPGVGLKSVATQVRASNIGESTTVRNEDDPYGELESHDDDGEGDLCVTATNEGGTNAGLEFHEEDEELESESSNKGLGLHKPHALFLGEIEPSTDDQSVFVTGDDDPDESGKVARSGKHLSHPRTTGVREKRRT